MHHLLHNYILKCNINLHEVSGVLYVIDYYELSNLQGYDMYRSLYRLSGQDRATVCLCTGVSVDLGQDRTYKCVL